MLNTIVFEVLDNVLDGNVFSTDCYFSQVSHRRKLDLITRRSISYKEFINQTKHLILEYDVANYDEDADYFEISIDLTEETMNKIITFAKNMCLNEFENLKKKNR